MERFEEVEHTADWAFRAFGKTPAELFENAAYAMFALAGTICDDPPVLTRDVEVSGADRETLLVNWLNELLYWQETALETYDRFEILELSDTRLRARVHGRPLGEVKKLIKAATFHNLAIENDGGRWQATVVVDV